MLRHDGSHTVRHHAYVHSLRVLASTACTHIPVHAPPLMEATACMRRPHLVQSALKVLFCAHGARPLSANCWTTWVKLLCS
jgi:hypothetical protein